VTGTFGLATAVSGHSLQRERDRRGSESLPAMQEDYRSDGDQGVSEGPLHDGSTPRRL
jgi:hypothetical protein